MAHDAIPSLSSRVARGNDSHTLCGGQPEEWSRGKDEVCELSRRVAEGRPTYLTSLWAPSADRRRRGAVAMAAPMEEAGTAAMQPGSGLSTNAARLLLPISPDLRRAHPPPAAPPPAEPLPARGTFAHDASLRRQRLRPRRQPPPSRPPLPAPPLLAGPSASTPPAPSPAPPPPHRRAAPLLLRHLVASSARPPSIGRSCKGAASRVASSRQRHLRPRRLLAPATPPPAPPTSSFASSSTGFSSSRRPLRVHTAGPFAGASSPTPPGCASTSAPSGSLLRAATLHREELQRRREPGRLFRTASPPLGEEQRHRAPGRLLRVASPLPWRAEAPPAVALLAADVEEQVRREHGRS
ncbi:hypothetical protein BS78_02G252900 [Paspalum vaginatum]|nr:hypothetical protein BS78_02G252900 [Paspalum vaginatum]